MKLDECGLQDEIFTHEDRDTDPMTIRHFNATAMNVFAADPTNGMKIGIMPIEKRIADYMRTNRGIEQEKLDRLIQPYLHYPMIFAEMPNKQHLSVDGHHRYVKRYELGLKNMLYVMFPYGTWDRFLLEVPKPATIDSINAAEKYMKENGFVS